MWTKILTYSLSGTFITIYILKKYFGGVYCKCKDSLEGKVIIITGASSGIGKETATILASKGAEVILACRNRTIGLEVVNQIRQKTQNPLVDFEELDLSRFESIIDFVNRFKRRGSKLYGLINNAGLFYVPYKLTDNGFDVTLQTNYLGPFLLTYLLVRALREGAPSRVVNIASESHWYPERLDVPSLVIKPHDFNEFVFYGATKLCLMLFTTKLAKLLHGSGVTVNSVNPGNVRSNIHRHFPAIWDLPLLSLSRFLLWLTFKTPHQGAQTSVHLLTDPALASVSGKYFSDCEEKGVSNLARSATLEDELWKCTLRWLRPFLEKDGIGEGRLAVQGWELCKGGYIQGGVGREAEGECCM